MLIPRPESEDLVDAALAHLHEHGIARPDILDLGTGSGCVAVALAHARPDARVTAVEASAAALALARRNARRHALDNIELVEGEWFAPLNARSFDVIVANPPYVRSDDPHLRRGDTRFEPVRALDGGPDGLAALREIAAGAPHFLRPGGLLAVEHGPDQAQAVVELLRAQRLVDIGVRPDLAGLARVTVGRRADDAGHDADD
ncbi:MAG: peptide chain release factor N(5)-glutamine methyltransferase [Halofilum sp. (in: g-proteobacteria)]|nr:peptide chain release factor N(5)-glutamine methyltransferase [Halofilum sp. (in: g-proteobacteria)]